MIMRGGSSKGAYFLADDLPANDAERDDLLLRIMGSPDERQIDGIGGAHPLTSKVAIVSPGTPDEADVNYLFLQVGVDKPLVSDRQNCGNLLAGVAPFAVERGLLAPSTADGELSVRILMQNTGAIATATLTLADGAPLYHGDTTISGVPGGAAPIRLDFEDVAGGSTGALLPTGNVRDTVAGIDCTLIDNGMPVVVMRADTMGIDGSESCADLEGNTALRSKLERMRLSAGELMNLGDVTEATIPKLTMVSPPRFGGHLTTRTFIPHRCHEAIGVLGAVSVATAAKLEGSPASEVVDGDVGDRVVLEHPTGSFVAVIGMSIENDGALTDGGPNVQSAGIIRTARKLMDGDVFPRT